MSEISKYSSILKLVSLYIFGALFYVIYYKIVSYFLSLAYMYGFIRNFDLLWSIVLISTIHKALDLFYIFLLFILLWRIFWKKDLPILKSMIQESRSM